MIRYFLISLLCFLPLMATGENNEILQGGQEVEDIKLATPDIDIPADLPRDLEELQAEKRLMQDALASDVIGQRPPPSDRPTPVKIGLYVNDIAMMNEAEQTFSADATLIVRWIDPRLKQLGANIRQFEVSEIWNPLISIANERELKKSLKESIFVDEEGHAIYAQRFRGTFTVPLNLKNFPFDQHKLSLQVRSFFSPNEVQLLIDQSFTEWAKRVSIPDWIVSGGKAEIDSRFSEARNKEQAQFVFSFKVERLIGFYLWKVILPLSLIVFMSWGVFWIDPRRLEAQVALSATAFLTLFAYQFAIASHLPRIAYLTRMDRFTMLCSLLVLLSLIEAIIASVYVKREQAEKALRLDRWSRMVFPSAFVVILLFSFWWI